MRQRRRTVAILLAVTCLTAVVGGAAGAGGGAVLQPETHTDFGTGDEATPTTVENFSIGGIGDDATLTGPVGGDQKGGGVVADGGSVSWSETTPSTSQTAINVTGVTNSQWSNVTGSNVGTSHSSDLTIGGSVSPEGPANGNPELEVTAKTEKSTYNPVSDEGDGSTGTSLNTLGDGGNDETAESEFRIDPTKSGNLNKLTLDIDSAYGSEYNPEVDIYVSESGVNNAYGEGTKVKSGWNPNWSTGEQSVSIDPFSVSAGTTYTVEFVTTNTDNDGTFDTLSIKAGYAPTEWVSDGGSAYNRYGDLTATIGADVSNLDVTLDGQTKSLGNFTKGEIKTVELTPTRGTHTLDFTSASNGEIDYNLQILEKSETRDPVVELNGDPSQQVTVDGTLGAGETVIKEVDSSWLEANNTATVSLDDSSLPEGSPPMEARVSAEVPAQSARYVSAPYDALSASGGVGVNWSGSGTLDVTVQGYDGSSWVDARELSASQTGDVDLNYEPIDYEQTRVEIVADGYVQIEEESLLFETYEPEIDESSATPSDGNGVTGPPVELSVDVSDRDFGFLQSDTVEVEFFDASDDTSFGTTTLTSAGTATETFDDPVGGLNSWYVVATDSHGNEVTSSVFEFRTPSVLQLRNESTPGQFVTEESDIEVRFFGQESGKVITRTATNGTIDMTGLPVDEPLIASTDANGYFQRSIAIDSILEQQRMFLLPESADASQVDWVLDDNSGRFDPGETTLFIERPIEIDGETEYRTIYGEQFGGTGRTASTLATGDRYRLRVENQDGNTRLLGSYLAAGAAQETLTVGSVDFPGLDDTGTAFSATLDDGDGVIDYRFADDAAETSELTVEVYQNGDLVQNATLNGPIQTVREQIPLSSLNHTEGDSYRIEYEAQRNGIVVDGTRIVGDVPEIANEWNIDPGLLNILGFVTVIASFGAVVILSPRHAGIVASSVLFGLSIIGVVTVSNILVGFAFVVSGVFAAAGGNP